MTTRVHVLGSGTPTPTPERFGTAFAIEVDDELIMVDCGPATTWKLVRAGFRPTDVSTLFFTHHHFDHNVDYPCFLLTRWDQGAGLVEPLEVIGPHPTTRLTDRLVGPDGAFADDIEARVQAPPSQHVYQNRGGTLPRLKPVVQTQDITAGFTRETERWTVRSAPAEHVQPYLDSVAYRFDTAAGSVVFTGDTQPCDTITELARGADLLFCMCWDLDERMVESGEDTGQCGVDGAARTAEAAGVGTLVLVHTGPHISTDEVRQAALERAGAIFGGRTVFADELSSYDLT
ncbi:MBL fold metallo-hydrolase [Microlunatus sp. Y2014]|uniref:MBL fold metallo-hydrolase n=1 Tax=Microlunatus sp. Y2014 TaxID=3418488 RepID=UPI003DA7887D